MLNGLPINNHLFSLEFTIAKHMCERLQRGFEYVEMKNLWHGGKFQKLNPDKKKNLVLSGGVASNQRLRKAIEKVLPI